MEFEERNLGFALSIFQVKEKGFAKLLMHNETPSIYNSASSISAYHL
jgi:hypothetical protein